MEEPHVATRWNALEPWIARCRVVACATAVGLTLTSVAVADDAAPAEEGSPRTLMRLPGWIESLGSNVKRVAKPLELSAHAGATETEANQPRRLPTASRVFTPKKAVEDARPSPVAVSRASDEPRRLAGRPGGRLLRSRSMGSAAGLATLTGGWNDLVAEESSADETVETTTSTDVPPATPDLPPAAAAEQSADAGPSEPDAAEPVEPIDPAVPAEIADSPAPAEAVAEPVAEPVTIADDVDVAEEDTPATKTKTVEPSPTSPRPAVEASRPVAIAPDETPTLAIDPASFNGVLPGTTTREELFAAWGDGESFERADGTEGFFWEIEPFERVEVILDGDVVGSIYIRLAEPVAVSKLARQLDIADLRTVSVLDAEGVSVGEVFPERGVIFGVEPGTQAAKAVMLEPLDPEAFVLRAEGDLETSVANAIVDLQYAVEIDPQHRRAHRLLLVLLCDQGRWTEAARLAETAEKLDPEDPWTALKRAEVLTAIGKFDEARSRVMQVVNREELPPLMLAQAQRQLGRIELAMPSPDYEQAVANFTAAIRQASPLCKSHSGPIRRAAMDIEFDAHLGTALAIASGNWQQKARVLPKWTKRAENFAADLREEEGGNATLELRLCQGVLEICAASADAEDPMPWVKRLLAVRSQLAEKVDDPWRLRQIDWEVGHGLIDALTAAQIRGDTADMLENATLTAAYLERGGEQRQLTLDERREFGDLLFRIGILHSLQEGDHETAVTWFERTLPLWEENPSFAQRGELGRQGESYVSMAISFWQVEKRKEAMELSGRGVDLMVAAVAAEELEERSLAVAYGNLSTMYAEQGDAERAEMYAEMASRAEATGTTLK